MSQRKSTLINGFAILSIAGVLSKVIGMFFRIYMNRLIGLDGMGVYQTVYPAYNWLLTISIAGIPVAISRMVSESIAVGRHKEARALLKSAFTLLSIVGLALTLLLIAVSGPLAQWVKEPEAAIGYIAIAPAILIVSLMSVLRGYMQGRSNMTPTAVSQVIEQFAKVIFAMPLAVIGSNYGIAYASAGALLGITIGEGLALLYMAIVYRKKRKAFLKAETSDTFAPSASKDLAKKIVRLAIPITIGSMIVPLSTLIDSAMIRRRLDFAGFGADQARVMYSALTNNAIPLINIPTVFATAVCIGLVPLISAARVEKRTQDMHETSQLGLRLGSLIGFPCSVGMSMLATPITRLIYGNAFTPDEIILCGEILALSALTILFFTQVQATTGILQGAGWHKVPMYSLVAGVAVKVLLNYVLIAIPSVNIYGAPIASLACYAISMLINLVWIVRKTGLKINWGSVLFRPAGATAGMAVAVLLAMRVLDMQSRVSAILAIALGVLVYVVLAFLMGAIRRDDLEQIPGGKKFEKLLIKLRVFR